MRHLQIFLLISFLTFFLSCQSENSPPLTGLEFSGLIAQAVSEEEIPVKRITELPPDDALFLAFKSADRGFTGTAVLLALHSRDNLEGLMRKRAAELVVRLNLTDRNYKDAEFQASRSAAEFPDEYFFKRAVCEAEYWQHKDRQVLDSIQVLRKLESDESDYELFLFEAVSSYRIKMDGWQDCWISMFYNVPASDFIRRAWDYLLADSEDAEELFKDSLLLINAKYMYSKGEYTESAELFRDYIEQSDNPDLSNSIIIDIENAFLRSGRKVNGAKVLESAAAAAEDEYITDCLFAAARLYRKAGWFRDAGRCMDSIIDAEGIENVSDRLLWYSLDIKARSDLTDAMKTAAVYSEHWESPEYFSDILDNMCTSLTGRRRWADVRNLALLMQEKGPDAVYDRARFITEKASSAGFLKPVEFQKPVKDLYYRILFGDSLEEFKAPVISGDIQNEAERFIAGLLDFGVADVLQEVKRYRESLSEGFVVKVSESLAAEGKPLDSIRAAYQYPGELSPAGYRALYPDVYRDEIESAAFQNDVPVQLLFAIVWKESGFEHDIVSRAGAVGLSQLMPSTAEDVAGRTGFAVNDLTNPEENLFLGSWYFNWLSGYAGNNAAAVLSYNGGPGRVKTWMRSYSDLPMELFYETIPVAETHDYGKKVVSAAVLYGMFYYKIPAEDTLKLFFSN